MIDWNLFHFLRPQWFYLIAPLLLILWLIWRQRLPSRGWRAVVAPHLLPHMLIGETKHTSPWSLLALALGGLLAITAAAGPVWKKLEQPTYRQQSALVVLLDLSRSMDATDIRPSRLQRARLKLIDILNARTEGQTALITYAALPFVVTPLTTDNKTIIDQLPSLTTDLMPTQGSRADRAIEKAILLLRQAGIAQGSVLLITDGASDSELVNMQDAITKLTEAGHDLHILGVGTDSGAPIPKAIGGFVVDNNGAIIIPKLDTARLRDLATLGHGIFRSLRFDDSDFKPILASVEVSNTDRVSEKTNAMMTDQWQEQGAWLLLPLMLIVVFSFRRGVLSALLLTAILFPQSKPALALDWDTLWNNTNQRAKQALDEGDEAKAAELFQQQDWRAAALYRANKFEEALKTLEGMDSAEAAYNRGNTLVKMNKLSEALNAYEEAIKQSPGNEDARYNYELVKQVLEQQTEQEKGQSGQDKQQGDQSSEADQDQQGQSDSQQSDGQQGQQQIEQQQSVKQDEKNNTQSDSQQPVDQQKAPQQSDKQEDGLGGEQSASQIDDHKKEGESKSSSTLSREAEQLDDEQSTDQVQSQTSIAKQSIEENERQQATEQWLRRIPDDPGGLWRRKFLYQYQRQKQPQGDEEQAW